MPVLIVVIIALIGGFYFYSRKKNDGVGGGNWVQFFAQGKDVGFSFKEIELLRQLAVKCELEEPASLFYSQSQLDKCIRSMVRGMRMSGESEDQGTHDFLSKLYDYRKKIEMNKPKIKHGISNSRQIMDGQMLQIQVSGTKVFKSQVVKNTNQYLTISRPVSSKNNSSSAWQGTKVSVYFSREGDAGYVFDTVVQDEVFSKGISSLKVAHSDSLFRTQKRKSIRIKLHKAAFLYLVPEDEPPHKLELVPGLKCFLEDLSDTGCAVTVAGKTDPGLRVKVQFALDNAPVCMTGTIRSTSFREDTGRSRLHIEAYTLPLETRNRILGEVFGVVPEEDDDELPFRVLDDEAAGIGPKPLAQAGLDNAVAESVNADSFFDDNTLNGFGDSTMLDLDDL